MRSLILAIVLALPVVCSGQDVITYAVEGELYLRPGFPPGPWGFEEGDIIRLESVVELDAVDVSPNDPNKFALGARNGYRHRLFINGQQMPMYTGFEPDMSTSRLFFYASANYDMCTANEYFVVNGWTMIIYLGFPMPVGTLPLPLDTAPYFGPAPHLQLSIAGLVAANWRTTFAGPLTVSVGPKPVDWAIEELMAETSIVNLNNGINNSLDTKLDNALNAYLVSEDRVDTANKLEAFKNSVEAQRGKKISDADADRLIASANTILGLL